MVFLKWININRILIVTRLFLNLVVKELAADARNLFKTRNNHSPQGGGRRERGSKMIVNMGGGRVGVYF